MKPNRTSGFQLGARIFPCIFLAITLGAWVCADSIKLTDGTVFEGTIVSENGSQFVIELQYASGTISAKQIVRKADVAEVTRLTAEQKTQQELEKAFEQVQEYQLDPNTSEPQSYYDHILNDVFRPFLRLYPDSPHKEEINQKIAAWTEERDRVASGLARVGTEWMPRAEAERRVELAHTQTLLEQGETLLMQSNFPRALNQFKTVISGSKQPEPVAEAKHFYALAAIQWYDSLAIQQQTFGDEIKLYEDRVDRTLQKRSDAESRLREAARPGVADDGRTREDRAGSLAKLQAEYDHALTENVDAARHLTGLRRQLSAVEKTMAEAHSCAVLYSISPVPANPQRANPVASPLSVLPPSPAPAQPPSSLTSAPAAPAKLESVGQFFASYWIYGAAVLIGGLWIASRFATRH